ncbi:hypothetical protein CEXT_162471 [Caerostris extrusa]|uniref:Uncharacterized protein n=1 Tax=Caerostris extrusa TaxID=172846 RepID=A0AAV4M8B9_CAEEX|nr:hypothetical protein CEXT_162471 [Caerostris extrusa]
MRPFTISPGAKNNRRLAYQSIELLQQILDSVNSNVCELDRDCLNAGGPSQFVWLNCCKIVCTIHTGHRTEYSTVHLASFDYFPAEEGNEGLKKRGRACKITATSRGDSVRLSNEACARTVRNSDSCCAERLLSMFPAEKSKARQITVPTESSADFRDFVSRFSGVVLERKL